MDREKFPELRTKRLLLREIKSSEAQWYLEHFSRKEIVEGQGYPPPESIKGAREELDKYIVGLFRTRTGFRWGVELKDREGLIGSLGLFKWEKPYGHKAEMGYEGHNDGGDDEGHRLRVLKDEAHQDRADCHALQR
jgi:[ribosomal protein S5]-alanine N-acetyltransferase